MPRIVVGNSAIGTAVGKLRVPRAVVMINKLRVPGLDVPVDGLWARVVLWKLKV